jgi:hypothetical protein
MSITVNEVNRIVPTRDFDLSRAGELQGEHPGETAFWASSACAGRSPNGGRAAAGAPEPGSCVLVGPRGSGKTSFLASLGRAFELERPPEWSRFVAGGKLTGLINASPAISGAEQEALVSPEAPWTTYIFQIGLRSAEAGTTGTAGEMEVSILDTPGWFFETLAFEGLGKTDQDKMPDLVRAARNAHCLVLCIDVGERLDRKVRLVSFVNRLLGVGPRRVQRIGAKPWPARESPWERAPRLELPFDRVLVLLTHIEILCTEAARRLARARTEWLAVPPTEIRNLAAYRGLSAWGAAELLDLWPLAEDQIEGLDLLASSLKPNAQFAVCGVSAAGLERTPPNVQGDASEPLAPRSLGGSTSESLSFGPGESEPLLKPSPFGIWPSLLFMTTGRVVTPLLAIDRTCKPAVSPRWSRLYDGEGS